MIIIMDCNNICHIVKHTMGELSLGEIQTGVIFGFMRQLMHFATILDEHKFVFAWDSKKSKRRDIYPQYKMNRVKKDRTQEQEMFDNLCYLQFNEIRRKILPSLGFKHNYIMTGYEADDIIANIVLNNSGFHGFHNENITIISSDNDLLQLIGFADIYNPRSKQIEDTQEILKKYGTMSMYEMKALMGCSGDNVPGIEGMGEKRAIDFLKFNQASPLMKKKIQNWYKDGYDLSLRLVKLPFENMPIIKIDLASFDEERINYDAFVLICKEYGFNSFLKGEDIWIKRFNMR